jgi:hypothetical protein
MFKHALSKSLILATALFASLIAAETFAQDTPSSTAASQSMNCRVGVADAWGACPHVLHMKRGSFGLAVDGTVNPERYNQTYALDVGAGQTIIVIFASAHELSGSIRCPDGGDGPWSGTGNSFITKSAGTCFITVGANTRAGEPWTGRFTLAVVVK